MLKRTPCLLLLILSMNVFAVDKITVNGLFSGKAIVTIDGKQRILKVGKPGPEGVKLISANSREAVIEIDGEQKTYTLGTHIGSSFKEPARGKTVTIAPDRGGMYEVNGSINDFQVKFLVDTGASSVSMNSNHARRIGIDYKMEGREGLSETASGLSKIYIVNLDSVMVGGITIHDVEAAVHGGDFPRTILLGNSFLSRVKMIREGQMLLLEEKPR